MQTCAFKVQAHKISRLHKYASASDIMRTRMREMYVDGLELRGANCVNKLQQAEFSSPAQTSAGAAAASSLSPPRAEMAL